MSLTIASYGGGTNSTALLIDCAMRKIPVDLIMFADTGGERPETYDYVRMFSNWLVQHDYPAIAWVKSPNTTLEEDCLKRKALPALAYGGFKNCSIRFKIEPQDKYVNNWIPARETWNRGEKVIKLVGYDAGEPWRVKHALDIVDKKYAKQYPLIDRDIDRDGCKEIIAKAGLPQPGKSSCFFCPSMKKHEIMALDKEHPDLMIRALEIEANADLTTIKGLGRDFSWCDFVRYQNNQGSMFGECMTWYETNAPCECYDG
jgi:hypothetical protein